MMMQKMLAVLLTVMFVLWSLQKMNPRRTIGLG